jgi:type II secretory pathway pseudopilin PulG
MTKPEARTKETGMSLVELMIALGLFIIVLGGVSSVFPMASRFRASSQAKQLAVQLGTTSSSFAAIRNTAGSDSGLSACILSRSCNVDWRGVNLRNIANTGRVAGPTLANAVFYHASRLTICAAGTAGCTLAAVSEYRILSGTKLEFRFRITDTAANREIGTVSGGATDLSTFVGGLACPNGSDALAGIDAQGRLICREMFLPAGGGPPSGTCGGGASVSSMSEAGAGNCVSAPANVDTTSKPAGFFISGGDGTFAWGNCEDIGGLSDFFRNERATLTCSWQATCSLTVGHLVPRTCSYSCGCDSKGANCSTCYYDCSYCVNDYNTTQVCPDTNTHNATSGNTFNCADHKPGACAHNPLPQCYSRSCGDVTLVSSSGRMACLR